jgi:hypothetical protein
LLLAAADHGDAARPALYKELLRREVPLQVIIDPKTRGARLQTWPGGSRRCRSTPTRRLS